MTFKAGQSGNPGGKPRESEEFRELARSKAPAMLAVLEAIALDVKAPRKVRILAATVVIERAHGKARQEITGADGAPLVPNDHSHIDVARRLLYVLQAGAQEADTNPLPTQSETRQ